RRRLVELFLLPSGELRVQRIRDLLRHGRLDSEPVRQVAVVQLGPELAVGASIDQLRLDAHAISGALHAALDDGSDTQRRADLAQIARAFLVLEYRRSRYHLKIPEPRHLPQQLIVKP